MTKEEMIAKFKTWYPQFADKPTNIIDMAYDFASNRVKSNIWTNLYDEGFMALMAHIESTCRLVRRMATQSRLFH